MPLRSFAADQPRFVSPRNWLLGEGQRANEIAAPFDFTTGWTTTFSGVGSSAPILTPNYSLAPAPDGTFTATRIQASAGVSGFSGLTRAISATAARAVFIRTLSGQARLQIGTSSTAPSEQSDIDTTWRRIWKGPVDPAHRILALSSVAGNSQSIDVLVWGASSEPNASFPSSLVYPPTTGTSTRGRDSMVVPAAALFPTGEGSVAVQFVIPQNAPPGADQMIFQLDDSTDGNCIRFRNLAGGATIVAGTVIGGTPADAPSAGSMTAGVPVKALLTFSNAGRLAVLLNGGAVQSLNGLPGGLTWLRNFNNVAGSAGLFGEIGRQTALSQVIADGDMQPYLNAFGI